MGLENITLNGVTQTQKEFFKNNTASYMRILTFNVFMHVIMGCEGIDLETCFT